jgi:hypothetical protein
MFRHYLVKPLWVEFALQLNEGMVTAAKTGDGMIHATVEEVADWGGISRRTAWRVWKRLQELGWVSCPKRGLIVFDYSRKLANQRVSRPSESATVADSLKGVLEPSGKDETTHPKAQAEPMAVADPPSGEDAALDGPPEKQKAPSAFGEAVAVLVGAGADRAGAVAAVRAARKAGPVNLEALRRIAAAVAAMPSKPYRPGGLICAAVRRPELGQKILREAEATKRRGTTRPSCATVGTTRGAGEVPRLLEALERLRATRPRPGSAGELDHHDREREARAALVTALEARMPNQDARKSELERRLVAGGTTPGSLVWRRAWSHHWSRIVLAATGHAAMV